jgi:tetratricopeptide (TPR) repeat protein
MRCTNPAVGKLISLYEFGQLSNEEKKAFENHLLDCDHCFQSLYEMSPVTRLMRQYPEFFFKALKAEHRSSVKKKIGGIRSELWARIRNALAPLPRPIWLLAPIAAAALIVMAIHLAAPTGEYSDLARIEPIPYIPIAMRAGEAQTENTRLFKESMQFYASGDYQSAIAKLSLLVAKESTNAEAHFYLGLCYLLSRQTVDSAIIHLEKALTLGDNSFAEKCHWYLGNAFLLKEDGKKAIEEFDKVVEFEGDYEWQAREVVVEIERVRGKN